MLVAGVNDLQPTSASRLSYAVSDAKEVARGFNEAAGNLYQSVEVKLLDRRRGDARQARRRVQRDRWPRHRPSDVFVLYLAGHGKTVDGRYYFIPQDFAIDGEMTGKP